ncbi:rCG42825, partial [Rattus norvegicus]
MAAALTHKQWQCGSSQHPSTESKVGYSHTVEYYSVPQKNELLVSMCYSTMGLQISMLATFLVCLTLLNISIIHPFLMVRLHCVSCWRLFLSLFFKLFTFVY